MSDETKEKGQQKNEDSSVGLLLAKKQQSEVLTAAAPFLRTLSLEGIVEQINSQALQSSEIFMALGYRLIGVLIKEDDPKETLVDPTVLKNMQELRFFGPLNPGQSISSVLHSIADSIKKVEEMRAKAAVAPGTEPSASQRKRKPVQA